MAKQKAAIKSFQDPPLEMETTTEKLEGGTFVFRTITSRGVLRRQYTQVSGPKGSKTVPGASASNQFAILMRALRELLRKASLPTDEQYIWMSVEDGPWRPDDDPDENIEGKPYKLRTWHEHLIFLTEPLTINRLYGDLLHALDEISRLKLEDRVLIAIINLASTYSEFKISGKVNHLAILGQRATSSLAQGPQQKRNQSQKKLEIICRHAETQWQTTAAMRGDMINTGHQIASKVNEELRSLQLLTVGKSLSGKTIADYIAKGIRGGLLYIG